MAAVPGIDLCDQMPLLARHTDKLAVIRSMCHGSNIHEPSVYHTLTGNLSVTLPVSAPFADTNGRLELTQIGVGTSSDSLCGSNRDQKSSLLWTAPLRGTPTQFSFDVQQQAKFRVFEELMERRKLELVMRARQANRPKL